MSELKSSSSFRRVHFWPILFGLVFAWLAFQWAFILESEGRARNRDNLFGLFFVWMIPFIISLVQKRWRDSLIWLAAPISYVLVLSIGRFSINGQIQEARHRGEALMVRAELYAEAKGNFPSSLEALSSFDGQPIPKTGIKIWDCGEKSFYVGNSTNSYAYDDYEGGPFLSDSPYRTEFWIGFREYGFQEHKLRSGAEWDTDSGSGDYLIGKIDLDS